MASDVDSIQCTHTHTHTHTHIQIHKNTNNNGQSVEYDICLKEENREINKKIIIIIKYCKY